MDYNAIPRHWKMFKKTITPYDWEVINMITKGVCLIMIFTILGMFYVVKHI